MMQSGAGYIDVENKCVLFDTDEAKAWLKWFGDNVEAGSPRAQPDWRLLV